jgi:hypothetical protein
VLFASQAEHNPWILFFNSASSLFTQLTMPRFEVKQSAKLNLTSYSGLALIGQCCQAAQVEAVIAPKLPVSQGMKTSDLVKAMVGLLALGKSDFEAIEPCTGPDYLDTVLQLRPPFAWHKPDGLGGVT